MFQLFFTFVFSDELGQLQIELKIDYQNLLASANSLRIAAIETSIIKGNFKQKPIAYYLEGACRILYTWKLYQKSLDNTLNRIDIRNEDSIQQFKNVVILPHELASYLDQYLLYSTFLFAQK